MGKTWQTTRHVGKEILGGIGDGLKLKGIPLRQRVKNVTTGIKENALGGALAVGGATVGGLIGADIALAKAKAKARAAGEQAKAKVKEKTNEAKDKASDTWKQAAEKVKRRQASDGRRQQKER